MASFVPTYAPATHRAPATEHDVRRDLIGRGRCPDCGQQTHYEAASSSLPGGRTSVPITDDRVLRGRCLLCRPIPAAAAVSASIPSKKPSSGFRWWLRAARLYGCCNGHRLPVFLSRRQRRRPAPAPSAPAPRSQSTSPATVAEPASWSRSERFGGNCGWKKNGRYVLIVFVAVAAPLWIRSAAPRATASAAGHRAVHSRLPFRLVRSVRRKSSKFKAAAAERFRDGGDWGRVGKLDFIGHRHGSGKLTREDGHRRDGQWRNAFVVHWALLLVVWGLISTLKWKEVQKTGLSWANMAASRLGFRNVSHKEGTTVAPASLTRGGRFCGEPGWTKRAQRVPLFVAGIAHRAWIRSSWGAFCYDMSGLLYPIVYDLAVLLCFLPYLKGAKASAPPTTCASTSIAADLISADKNEDP